jgi:hypothetical protein
VNNYEDVKNNYCQKVIIFHNFILFMDIYRESDIQARIIEKIFHDDYSCFGALERNCNEMVITQSCDALQCQIISKNWK